MLTQSQIDIVKATVPVIEAYGNKVTEVFYHNLLTDIPCLKAVFNQANQIGGHQSKALAGSVYAYARNIDNLTALGPAVSHITNKHTSLFVKPEQYAIVGQYLLAAFAEVLGEAFTPDIRGAWAAAYQQLADIMIGTEQKMYEKQGTWTTWRDLRVVKKIRESSEITSFYFAPVDGEALPRYLPGQYISVQVNVPTLGYTQIRQYSLSDRPVPCYYRISVKREAGTNTAEIEKPSNPGFVSVVLHDEIKVGDIVQLSHPAGDFYLDTTSASEDPLVLISAGVGITPLMSMTNTLLANKSTRRISFIQGSRSTDAQAFKDHIREQGKSNKNFKATLFVKNVQFSDEIGNHYDHVGRVDLDRCRSELFLDNVNTRYYICGPSSFMTGMQSELIAYGVDASRIQVERFGTGSN